MSAKATKPHVGQRIFKNTEAKQFLSYSKVKGVGSSKHGFVWELESGSGAGYNFRNYAFRNAMLVVTPGARSSPVSMSIKGETEWIIKDQKKNESLIYMEAKTGKIYLVMDKTGKVSGMAGPPKGGQFTWEVKGP